MTPATRRTLQELKTMTIYTVAGIGSMLALSIVIAWLDGVI